jgi:hypothetical protein
MFWKERRGPSLALVLPGKRKKSLPSKEPQATSPRPWLLKQINKQTKNKKPTQGKPPPRSSSSHSRSRAAAFRVPWPAHPACLWGAKKGSTKIAPISPPSMSSRVGNWGWEFHVGEKPAGQFQRPRSPPRALASPPQGCAPLSGDHVRWARGRRGGEGSARGGEIRVYISSRGVGAAARPPARGTPGVQRLPTRRLSRAGPWGLQSPWSALGWRAGDVRSARPEPGSAGLGLCGSFPEVSAGVQVRGDSRSQN